MNEAIKRMNIVNLDSKKRYDHSIKQFVIQSKIWSLYDSGWALVSSGKDKIFPIWPDSFYAENCAKNEWDKYVPREIDLDEFLEEYLPDFHEKNFKVSVFMNNRDNSIVVKPEEILDHIEYEIDKYYQE